MSSWRETADPRCPECEGPLSPTASYCMHCRADLPHGDGADVSDADDVTFSGSAGNKRDARLHTWLFDRLLPNRSTGETDRDVAYRRPAVERDPQSDDGAVQPTSPLWLRLPVAVLVSIPVAIIAFFVVLGLAGHLSGSAGLSILVGGWVLTTAYLARKPFASDIVGDAAYALAALILLAPVLGYLVLAGRSLVSPGSGESIPTLVGELLVVEFFASFPAGLFATIGYVGNSLAARKLGRGPDHPDADEGVGNANRRDGN